MLQPTVNGPQFRMGFLWTICLVAAMGGLLFGYDWVVIGGAKPFYELYFGISEDSFMQGLAMSAALFGCLIGAAASGMFTDRFGRKWLLVLSAFLFAASSVCTALALEFVTFSLARLAGGIAIGLASNLSPMYIAEISPAQKRGQFVAINQLTVVIGILAAQIVNWLIVRNVPAGVASAALAGSWYADVGWRWMFAACAVPAAVFFLMMLFVPESPRWLAKAGQFDAAEEVLRKVGGSDYAHSEIENVRQTLNREEVGRVPFRDLLTPGVARILGLGIALAVLQQWCGINVIFNYAQEVFTAAGYSITGVMQSIVVTGIVNLVFTFVAIFTIDRWGRRPLMLLGAAGLALIYIILGAAYYEHSRGAQMVTLIVAAIGCYAMTLAPVTWVVIAEIFPNRIRGTAMSVAVFALWMACAILTFTFPYLNRYLGAHGTFWLYAAICIVGFIFIWRRLPETKEKTLEQIEAELAT
ncbi:MAG: sugar porter family MFS transporter [Pirellulales bacterium]|nr:sugar porter family MFS transporter [Pirellulales bacterium]